MSDSGGDNDSSGGESSDAGRPEVSNENLSAEYQEKVVNFIEFCGVEDEKIALKCLRQCNWDLEVAVQEYLNEKEGRPSVFSQEGQENQANTQQEQLRRRRVRIEEPPAGLVDHRRILFGRGPQLAVTDPEGDVRRFINEFDEKYGNSHPRFYGGTYGSALNEAKKELKFLLVYLHSPDHQDTDRFCGGTLCNADAVRFIADQDILLWGCSVKSPEGGRVSYALRESTYPFLALICLRDNKMVMTWRHEGFCTVENLLSYLAIAIQDNETYLNLERQKRQQRQLDQLLREEQESAFQESLLVDKEKEERRLAQIRKMEERELQEEREERNRMRMKEEMDARKNDILNNLPEEPSPDEADCVRVSLKFPSGARVERRFLNSDSLELLYNVAFIHEDCPGNFSLLTNFPRKVLNCRPSWAASFLEKYGRGGGVTSAASNWNEEGILTFEQAGLDKAVMIHVQNNEA